MKGCLVALGILAGLVIAVLGLFWLNFYDVHVRYRLTVEVLDGDQVKTGSSVIEVSYSVQPDRAVYLGGPDTHPKPVGYAPTVDLGEKGMLFVTFSNATRTPAQWVDRNKQVFCPLDDIGCLPFAAYQPGTGFGSAYSQQRVALDRLLHQSGPRDVPFIALPALMTFRDVDGGHGYLNPRPDDLAASFGPGVELKRVVLELTNDPVTPLPETWPQWLKEKGQMSAVLKGYRND